MFHIEHSPTIRRQLLLGRIITTIVTAILMLGTIYLIDRDKNIDPFGYVVIAVGVAVIFLLYPQLNRIGTVKRLRNLLNEGQNSSILGAQSIEINPEHIVFASSLSSSTIKWNTITEVKEDDNYIFIYISAANAVVIPKRAFTNTAEQTAFLQQLSHYRNAILPVK